MPPDQQLRDIRGLDAVSWWPPGPGWWALLLVLILLALAIYWLMRQRRKNPKRRWGKTLLAQLNLLQNRLENESLTTEETKIWLLDYLQLLRQIAILSQGRSACAGLWGKEWLAWLSRNDPKHFAWDQYAAELIHSPYAAPSLSRSGLEKQRLLALTKAAQNWVTARRV